MSNHPNRHARPPGCDPKPGETPTPAQVSERRALCAMTQAEAGAVIYASWRTWQDWERGERRMPAAAWELFCIKTTHMVARAAA